MEEVLYRGKRIDNGEWITGMPWIFSLPVEKALIVSAMGLVGEDDDVSRYCESDEVHPETIGQFTGGVDKNFNRIFEDDIFVGFLGYHYVVKYYPEYAAFMARCVETGRVDYLNEFKQCTITVVGNIHDNPIISQEVM